MSNRHLKKKIIALALAAITISGLSVLPVQAKDAFNESGDEYVNELVDRAEDVDGFGNDDGVKALTDVNSYGVNAASTTVVIIKDVTDWNTFATQCGESNSYFYGTTVKLANDIKFDGVSNNNYKQVEHFRGTFDGCGHTMSGLISTSYSGLFNSIESDGTVKNVTISDSTFESGRGYVGGVAGRCIGVIDNCHIRNTSVKGTNGYANTGGIVGESWYQAYVENCTVDMNSKIESANYAGGICGYDSGVINNCGNMAAIIGLRAGGIVGYSNDINNSYNTGMVTGTSGAGGIVYEAKGVLWNCYCSDESAKVPLIKSSQTANRYEHFALSDMQQQSFCDILNKNRGTNADWLEWEKTGNSVYPTLKTVKSITACNIALSVDKIEYTGEEQTPVVAITDGAVTLTVGADYTVTYSNNKEVGTASLLIEGTGRYCDSVERTFEIVKSTPAYTYTKIGTKTYGAAYVDLNVKANKGDLGTITYSSSSSKVASVSSQGIVTFNAPGTATITVKCSGTDYYEAVSFTVPVKVLPAKPVVKLSSKKKKITIKYGKVVGASGYEIQYSLKKNFKSGVKTFKITKTKKVTPKLKKGKKYFVRVRAYTNSGGQVLNSAWSSKKSIKVKK